MLTRDDPRSITRAARQFPNLGFTQARLHQRSLHLMQFRCLLAGAIIAQIVDVHAINHVPDAALRAS